jgi:RNA polymerase sigma factor (sigma-70 family)
MSGPFTTTELTILDSVISTVTRRLPPQDADDFRQTVYLRLMEGQRDLFERFRGDSSLKTYLFVVVRRMRLDWQNRAYGKWRPSMAARRAGTVVIVLDRLLNRDGYTVDQAIEYLRAGRRRIDETELRRVAASLPRRWRMDVTATEFSDEAQVVAFQDPIEERQRQDAASARQTALRKALARLDARDRELIRLRFYERVSVQEVAARMRTNPKPLYRRFDRIIATLRRQLDPARVQRGAGSGDGIAASC